MKAKLPLVLPCLLLVANAYAQTPDYPVYRHSIGVGFERVGLDGPDDIGNRFLVNYARHFRNDRIVVIANVGYVSALHKWYLPSANDYYLTGKPRERLTLDGTLAFDFLKHSRHAFRLGAGPSLWYRQDESLSGVLYTVTLNGAVSIQREDWLPQVKEVNYGFNVMVEYEYAFTERLLASAKLKFASLERAGQSSIYGVGFGYRLR